jgi:hypothetical protein
MAMVLVRWLEQDMKSLLETANSCEIPLSRTKPLQLLTFKNYRFERTPDDVLISGAVSDSYVMIGCDFTRACEKRVVEVTGARLTSLASAIIHNVEGSLILFPGEAPQPRVMLKLLITSFDVLSGIGERYFGDPVPFMTLKPVTVTCNSRRIGLIVNAELMRQADPADQDADDDDILSQAYHSDASQDSGERDSSQLYTQAAIVPPLKSALTDFKAQAQSKSPYPFIASRINQESPSVSPASVPALPARNLASETASGVPSTTRNVSEATRDLRQALQAEILEKASEAAAMNESEKKVQPAKTTSSVTGIVPRSSQEIGKGVTASLAPSGTPKRLPSSQSHTLAATLHNETSESPNNSISPTVDANAPRPQSEQALNSLSPIARQIAMPFGGASGIGEPPRSTAPVRSASAMLASLPRSGISQSALPQNLPHSAPASQYRIPNASEDSGPAPILRRVSSQVASEVPETLEQLKSVPGETADATEFEDSDSLKAASLAPRVTRMLTHEGWAGFRDLTCYDRTVPVDQLVQLQDEDCWRPEGDYRIESIKHTSKKALLEAKRARTSGIQTTLSNMREPTAAELADAGVSVEDENQDDAISWEGSPEPPAREVHKRSGNTPPPLSSPEEAASPIETRDSSRTAFVPGKLHEAALVPATIKNISSPMPPQSSAPPASYIDQDLGVPLGQGKRYVPTHQDAPALDEDSDDDQVVYKTRPSFAPLALTQSSPVNPEEAATKSISQQTQASPRLHVISRTSPQSLPRAASTGPSPSLIKTRSPIASQLDPPKPLWPASSASSQDKSPALSQPNQSSAPKLQSSPEPPLGQPAHKVVTQDSRTLVSQLPPIQRAPPLESSDEDDGDFRTMISFKHMQKRHSDIDAAPEHAPNVRTAPQHQRQEPIDVDAPDEPEVGQVEDESMDEAEAAKQVTGMSSPDRPSSQARMQTPPSSGRAQDSMPTPSTDGQGSRSRVTPAPVTIASPNGRSTLRSASALQPSPLAEDGHDPETEHAAVGDQSEIGFTTQKPASQHAWPKAHLSSPSAHQSVQSDEIRTQGKQASSSPTRQRVALPTASERYRSVFASSPFAESTPLDAQVGATLVKPKSNAELSVSAGESLLVTQVEESSLESERSTDASTQAAKLVQFAQSPSQTRTTAEADSRKLLPEQAASQPDIQEDATPRQHISLSNVHETPSWELEHRRRQMQANRVKFPTQAQQAAREVERPVSPDISASQVVRQTTLLKDSIERLKAPDTAKDNSSPRRTAADILREGREVYKRMQKGPQSPLFLPATDLSSDDALAEKAEAKQSTVKEDVMTERNFIRSPVQRDSRAQLEVEAQDLEDRQAAEALGVAIGTDGGADVGNAIEIDNEQDAGINSQTSILTSPGIRKSPTFKMHPRKRKRSIEEVDSSDVDDLPQVPLRKKAAVIVTEENSEAEKDLQRSPNFAAEEDEEVGLETLGFKLAAELEEAAQFVTPWWLDIDCSPMRQIMATSFTNTEKESHRPVNVVEWEWRLAACDQIEQMIG